MAAGHTVSIAREQQDFLVNVQCLRFLAALLVMLYHTWQGPYTDMQINDPVLQAVSVFGFAGVDMLFVISGFIIYYTTSKPDVAVQPTVFLYQRFVRVYLGYWPFYLMAILGLWTLNPARLAEINLWNSFWLLPDKLNAVLIGASWTLPYELYFYSLFFLLLFVPNRMAVLGVIAILVIAFNLYAAWFLDAYTWKGFRNLGEYERFFTAPWLLEFIAGSASAHIVRQNHNRFTSLSLCVGLLLFATAIILNLFVLDGKIAKFFNYHYRIGLFGTGTALLLYGAVNMERRGIAVLPSISLLFGGATYSLYLCHTIIIDAVHNADVYMWWQTMALPPAFGVWLLVFSMLAFAVIFYSFVEKPLYAWARKQIYRVLP